uniref:non-specific serine/threonine protein kinase n=1 Tax=Arion vulgaris TaxID=1028688 RepID=A0A0B6ZPA0_9EUPU
MGNEDFDCIRVIGKGSYGEVWLAKHKKDKKQYVLKKMNMGKASQRERKSAEQEGKLLSKLRHPNIVSYKDSFENDGFLYIAMQYCEGGDLYARLKEQKGAPLEERQVVEWFVQIAMALQYMHERNILHRDLKTQNIFLTKSKIIKIGDLGIARILDSANSMATTLIGTPYYMSPELFSNKPYNHKSDVWALGCCVYEMTTLKHAFNAKDMNSLVYKILKGKMPPMPCQYSSELLILMRSMLHQDPEKRPSVNRILRDPYIKKNIALFLEDTKRNSRQNSQPSVRQIALPVSRPTSASSNSRKDSAPSLSEVVNVENQAANIPPPQKPKIVENMAVKSSNVRKPAVSSHNLIAVAENVKQEVHDGSLSSDDALETLVPKAVREMQFPKKVNAPRKKFLLRNHVKSNSTEREKNIPAEQNEMKVQSRECHEKSLDIDNKPVCAPTTNNNDKIVPEFEDSKTRSKSQSQHKETESQEWQGKSRDIDKSLLAQAKYNDRSALELQVQSVQNNDLSCEKAIIQNPVKNSNKSEHSKVEAHNRDWYDRESDTRKHAAHGQDKSIETTTVVQTEKQSQKKENTIRPLPVPRVQSSAGVPQRREDRQVPAELLRSSSLSSSTEDKDTPRSLPNLSARQRRRQQKNECAVSKENPDSAARVKLRRVVERTESDKITKSERLDLEPARLQQPPIRQTSINDSTSSSDDSQRITGKEVTKDQEIKREKKEMNNFISLLDTTLQMNKTIETSEEEEEEIIAVDGQSVSSKAGLPPLPQQQQSTRDPNFHKSVSMPSVETLTDTSRLMHRIRMLHTDCMRGVGYAALKEAFAILNKIDEDEVEPKLVHLLGKDKFDEYAGKIWQLKFCEESLFEIPRNAMSVQFPFPDL